MGRSKVLVLTLALLGCVQPGPGLADSGLEDSGITAAPPMGHVLLVPARLALPRTTVGTHSSADFQVMNVGDAGLSLTLVTEAPFSVSPDQFDLAPGSTVVVGLTFRPLVAGPTSGTVQAGEAQLQVDAEAIAPTCTSNCDDGDACTVDSCNDAVCSHVALTCTGSDPRCQTARCDPTLGCIVENLPDGTLTGVDNCRVAQVDLCIGGQNGARSRPASGRCSNQWLPGTIPPREGHAMAWDSVRKRVVSFGGRHSYGADLDETWEYDGQGWLLRTPPMSPSARSGHVMAFDEQRGRVVLFGGGPGGGPGDETWEWDGVTWLHHHPATSPSSRQYESMAWDRASGRVVLFGGAPPLLGDTWEWDGVNWLQRQPPTAPGARAFSVMALDPSSNRVLLHGGVSLPDNWTWDGATWTQVASTPSDLRTTIMAEAPGSKVLLLGVTNGVYASAETWLWGGSQWARAPGTSPQVSVSAAAFDAEHQRVVMLGGRNQFGVGVNDTWEWDGAAWVQRSDAPTQRDLASAAWDQACSCVVMFGGFWNGATSNETWEWHGAWVLRSPATSPSPRYASAMAFDEARQRLVLFGGYGPILADTWEWDGTTWHDVTPPPPLASPPARDYHRLAYDAARQRVVLFGGAGASGALSDTWTWDGTTWTELTPATSPSARASHSMTYDPTRQRVVLFGGKIGYPSVALTDLWEWDGATWALQSPPGPAPQEASTLFFEPGIGRVVLAGDVGASGAGGGSGGATGTDMWEWDGARWTARPSTSPPLRFPTVAAFDEAHRRLFVFDVTMAWHYYP